MSGQQGKTVLRQMPGYGSFGECESPVHILQALLPVELHSTTQLYLQCELGSWHSLSWNTCCSEQNHGWKYHPSEHGFLTLAEWFYPRYIAQHFVDSLIVERCSGNFIIVTHSEQIYHNIIVQGCHKKAQLLHQMELHHELQMHSTCLPSVSHTIGGLHHDEWIDWFTYTLHICFLFLTQSFMLSVWGTHLSMILLWRDVRLTFRKFSTLFSIVKCLFCLFEALSALTTYHNVDHNKAVRNTIIDLRDLAWIDGDTTAALGQPETMVLLDLSLIFWTVWKRCTAAV